MKILIVHNSYQRPGGEDQAAAAEARLLEIHGHTVLRYERGNEELRGIGLLKTAGAGISTAWSTRTFLDLKSLIASAKPDIAHFHNTFPLISPAGYYACAEAGVPVVQTLHNYRLLCPGSNLERDGKVCEECIGRSVAWPGLRHGCYHSSRAATAAAALMLSTHRAMGTWARKVNIYVALSEFARRKFIDGGLIAERIVVKPNFVERDPGPKSSPGQYALYVGRLAEEKGVRVLLRAWELLAETIPLKIVGDGPLAKEMTNELRTKKLGTVEFLGSAGHEEIFKSMHGARFLIVPSICYENFPLVIAEAFACGLPVIASRLGAMAEIIAEGNTGLGFNPGDASDLASKVHRAWIDGESLERMGWTVRAEFEACYRDSTNYEQLIQIYAAAIDRTIPERLRAAAVG